MLFIRLTELARAIYQNSQSENNIEYNHKLQNFLSVHSEPYPDADTLVIFFTNTK